jgi:hypothetical protein
MKANYKFAHNKALHRTAIPLRSIAAGELERYGTQAYGLQPQRVLI